MHSLLRVFGVRLANGCAARSESSLGAHANLLEMLCPGSFYTCIRTLANTGFKWKQDKIFRRKRLRPGANFVFDYLEIWDKDILKFNELSK